MLILICERCQRRMGSLEPFVVIDDAYLCRACGVIRKQEKEDNPVVLFYRNVEINSINDFSG